MGCGMIPEKISKYQPNGERILKRFPEQCKDCYLISIIFQ
jgi:hypothetical protein